MKSADVAHAVVIGAQGSCVGKTAAETGNCQADAHDKAATKADADQRQGAALMQSAIFGMKMDQQ